MKYHTSPATIIISILILLVFVVVSSFCVFSLNIGSPSLMILSSIEDSFAHESNMHFSFASIDRNMANRVVVNDVLFTLDNGLNIKANKIIIYQNPIEIIKQLLFKNGRFEVDVEDVTAYIPSSILGGNQNSNSLTIESINSIVSSLEDHSELFDKSIFYNYAYSLNVENLSIEVEDIIKVEDMRLNLSLDRYLDFDSFRFSLPTAIYRKDNNTLSLKDFNFIAQNQGSYLFSFSLSSLQLENETMNISVKDLASELNLSSFRDFDLYHLPFSFSFTALKGDVNGIKLNIGRSYASANESALSGAILSSSAQYSNYEIKLPQLSYSLKRENDNFNLNLNVSESIRVKDGSEVEFDLRNNSFDILFGKNTSLYFTSDEVAINNIKAITNGILTSISLPSLHLSYQLNENTSALEGSSSIVANSDNSFFNSTKAELAFSASLVDNIIQSGEIDIDSLAFPLLESVFTSSLSYKDENYTASIKYSDELSLQASGKLNDFDIDLSFFGFPVISLMPLIEEHAPALKNYIASETAVSGSLSLKMEGEDVKVGDVDGSLAISSIKFNDRSFGLASRIDASINEDNIYVDSLTLTSEIIRASYSGSINKESFFPEGNLSLEMTESGSKVLNIDFTLNQEKEYSFNATVPYFENSYFNGSVNWARDKVIISEGTLKSGEALYPFDLTVDLANYRLDLISDGIIVSLDYDEKLDLLIDFDSFMLPPSKSTGEASIIDGTISYYFGFAEQVIEAEAPDFTISNISRIASRPTISLDFIYNDSGFRADNITLTDSYGTMSGMAVYERSSSSFAFTLGSEDEGRANISIMKDQGGYSGILSLQEIKLDRFGSDGTILTTSLVGYGSSLSDFSFSGTLSAYPGSAKGNANFSADVILDSTSLTLQDLSYSSDTLSASSKLLFVNISDGHFSGDIDVLYERVERDRSYPLSLSASLSLELGSHNSILDMIFALPALIKNSLSAQISINNLDIDNLYKIDNKVINADFSTSRLLLDGNFITGSYDFESGNTDIEIKDNEIINAHIKGVFKMDQFDLDINDFTFDIGVLNFLYPVPVVTFEKGSVAYGDLLLYGSFEDSHLYGQVYSDGFDMNIWWLDEDYVKVGDVFASIVDNHATTNKTAILAIDRVSGEINRAYGVAEAQLSNANILDFYNLTIDIPDGNSVHVWTPIQSQNMQIKADVSGTFNLYSDLRKNYLSGDLIIDNAVMSIGMDPLPAWYDSRMVVNNNFNVILRNRCSFVMPLGDDPIISAYFEENTAFSFGYDSQDRTISLDGALGFRSGEIYYFEKNFYITEGSLTFAKGTSSRLSPLLNLRARLRDFDSNGDKVDIYLVLTNSTLDNISPSFESSPQKDINEIMSILGEAILPSTAYGDLSLSSVASLVTSGLDVMSRAGLLGSGTSSTNNLSNVIRSSLGLDMFSMRSSILRNLIIDNIFYSPGEDFSPMARYLNDTNIYLGKYLSKNFFLQGLIHLEAVKNSERSFLASDLELDIEISLEWQTPLGEITFATSPMNLSLYNIFDSFSLSYSNRIRF